MCIWADQRLCFSHPCGGSDCHRMEAIQMKSNFCCETLNRRLFHCALQKLCNQSGKNEKSRVRGSERLGNNELSSFMLPRY